MDREKIDEIDKYAELKEKMLEIIENFKKEFLVT